MIMFNKLPYFIILKGKKYKINVDFRNMILFEKKVQDRCADNSEIIEFGLRHFYPDFFYLKNFIELIKQPDLYKEACDKLLWFYKCGRDNYHKVTNKNNNSNRNNRPKQIYSFEFDDEYIYGAFLEQYNIDLTCRKLHWWKFKALLNSLNENTEFVKIKGYRAYEGKDKNMLELKQYWQLPLPIEEQDRLNRIFDVLNNK